MSETVKAYSLNKDWYIDIDPDNTGKQKGWDSAVSPTAVPTTVPSIIQETFPDHHGTAFYWCRFVPKIDVSESDRVLLRFAAADYKAEVFLNGEYLGEHETGETPFSFDITGKVDFNKENLLSVRVVNPTLDDIDGLNMVNIPNRNKAFVNTAGSCTNHGGLWGEVSVVSLPAVYIDDVFLIGDIRSGKLRAKVTVNNTTDRDCDITVSLNVYERYNGYEKVSGTTEKFVSEAGTGESELSLTVPDVKLWDTDDPNLYRAEVIINSNYGTQSRIESFGFRELVIKDGFFYLNGKKIFIKSSHTGNAFPIGQGYPVIKDQIRKDMIMAKTYGFNMVRSISGMLRKEQLEICDEIGLMVYEECFAAWNLGVGFFLPGLGADRIGDEELMLRRFDLNTVEMIKRDRNHPCITVWGLLNEMKGEWSATKRAKELLPTVRQADPTRLVLLNSGRWDRYADTASGSNPYSDVWDAAMGGDLTEESDTEKSGDMHFYPSFPFNKGDFDYIRSYCRDYRPAFFSESGMGPLFNVTEEAKHYEQYGYRRDLEDYRWIKSQSEKLEEDWQRLGLEKVYPYPEMMLKESQRLSAEDRRRIFDAVRSNPKFNGYSLTGLLDHGWCGEGLWSLWRRFKPEVYDAVCDGWAPLRFCLFLKTHVFSTEEFETEAVLANENVLSCGTYTADFAITGESGTVMKWSETFDITDDSFSVPVMKKKITLDVPTGKYSLIAYMREASPMGNRLDFYVTDTADIPTTEATVAVCGVSDEMTELLKRQGADVRAYDNTDAKLILAGKDITSDDILSIRTAVRKGAKVLFADIRAFDSEENKSALGIDGIEFADMWNWLYHKEVVLSNREIFKGLGYGLADQKIMGTAINRRCIKFKGIPDDVICPAFYTGYHGVEGSYACVHDAVGLRFCDGMIYINAMDISGTLGTEPASSVLLMNYINYLC